ncbi:MAG: Crp/Fnr family transcriptional regulator [Bacteroides sp.]|nr:Crp/Fnr family transcriptional regulator [Bacteroides sp.]MDE5827268.1 Crp/Fnr family transcriptional regulator [Duncaniella sp.]MDE6812862.1 Crp/Fnr family transcriptional regulator [Duncaniella sp.]MDE6823855.1 Crp/Fnr family transcriptional regulator [Duncaniella sp.]
MIRSTIDKILTEELTEIWNLLTNEEKRLLIDNFTIHHYKKNKTIYAEGDEPEYLWALIDGKVKKYKDGVGGRVQILRLINPGQYFGYRAYFAGEPYVSSAGTLEESVLGTLPMSLVQEMISKNNRLAMFFIHELSHNLGNSDTKIVNLTQKHIRARLAEALLVLRDNYGYEDDDNMTLKIYMAREDLANLSNMTTSNAIRTLSNFGSEKIIVVDGRKIKILNEALLKKISKFG